MRRIALPASDVIVNYVTSRRQPRDFARSLGEFGGNNGTTSRGCQKFSPKPILLDFYHEIAGHFLRRMVPKMLVLQFGLGGFASRLDYKYKKSFYTNIGYAHKRKTNAIFLEKVPRFIFAPYIRFSFTGEN